MLYDMTTGYYDKYLKDHEFGFEKVCPKYAIDIKEDGTFIRITSFEGENGESTANNVTMGYLDNIGGRNGETDAPYILCDNNTSYTLGIRSKKDNIVYAEKYDIENAEAKGDGQKLYSSFYAEKYIYNKLYKETGDETLLPICNFYEKWDQLIQNNGIQSLIDGEENGLKKFITKGIGEHVFRTSNGFIVMSREVHDYLNENRSDLKNELHEFIYKKKLNKIKVNSNDPYSKKTDVEMFQSAAKISGVRGSGTGTNFTSTKAESDRRFDIGDSENPFFLSRESMDKHVTTIKHLANTSGHHINCDGAPNLNVLFWTDNEEDNNLFLSSVEGNLPEEDNEDIDPFAPDVLDTSINESKNRKAIGTYSGKTTSIVDASDSNNINIIGFTAKQGQPTVEFYYQKKFTEVVENSNNHNRRLTMDGDTSGFKISPTDIIAACRKSKDENLSAITQNLYQSIIFGKPYDINLVKKMIERFCMDNSSLTRNQHVRAAMLKAYLTRNTNKEDTYMDNVRLDESNTSQAYLFGRWFATFERLQHAANGTNTVRRMLNDAKTAPKRTMTRHLFKLQNAYLNSLNPGLRFTYDEQLANIGEKMGVLPDKFTLDQEAEFILGYYQQKAETFRKIEENKKAKEAGETDEEVQEDVQ